MADGKIITPGFRQKKVETKKQLNTAIETKIEGLQQQNQGMQRAFGNVINKLTEMEASITTAFGYHDLISLSIKRILTKELGITEEKWNKNVEIVSKELNDKKEAQFDLQEGFKTIAREAKVGDFCAFAFEGTVDGKPFEGGKSNWVIIELGKQQVLKEMDDSLIGKKAGDIYDTDVTFPKEYPSQKKLEGKTASFKIKIISVKEKIEKKKEETISEKK